MAYRGGKVLHCSVRLDQGFKIWPDDPRDATDLRIVPKLIGRRALLSPAITESFDCNIQANLVAILETVGDRLGGIVNFDLHALDGMRFDAGGKSLS